MTDMVAVVGAGVCGLSVALALTEAGVTVTLYDPSGFPGQGASASAAGMLTPSGEAGCLPLSFVQAGQIAIDHWKARLAQLCPDALVQRGSLLVASPEDETRLDSFQQAFLPPGSSAVRLSRADLSALEPDLAVHWQSGLFFPNDAHLDVALALTGLVTRLRDLGCRLILEAVDPADMPEPYAQVIDCRGWGAKTLDGLMAMKGESLTLACPDGPTLSRPTRFYADATLFYAVPGRGHDLTLGATVRAEPDPDALLCRCDGLATLVDAAAIFDSRLERAHVTTLNAGVRPAYEDRLPRIVRSDAILNANGLYRHGFLLSPLIAETIRADILGVTPPDYARLFTTRQNQVAGL
ncbi:MAG: FAD-dependent oxidoreductase [Asticcacaulis sp.]